MNYLPPAKLFAPAAVARNQESSRCVILGEKDPESCFVLGSPRPVTDDRQSFSDDYELVVRQKPVAAKVFIGKEKGMTASSLDCLSHANP